MALPSVARQERLFPYYATLPAIIIVILVGLLPTVYTFILSLKEYSLISPDQKFVGLSNYVNLLFHDPRYLRALAFTIIFGLIATSLELLLGFLLAFLLADKEVPNAYSALIRTLIMVPFVCAPVVMSYTFKTLIYDRMFGYLNYFLSLLHFGAYDVFKGTINAPLGLLVMEVFLRTPFITIITYAGISSIDETIYDAAEIDGVTVMKKITHIIIPCIRPIIVIAFVLRFMDVLKMFDEIYVLTGGGPGYLTENVTLFIVDRGFTFFQMGYAAAGAFTFLVLVVVLISFLMRRIEF